MHDNVKPANKNLMRAIGDQEVSDIRINDNGIELFTKQMWDSETGTWVPFDLWGAHYIVNQRKEYVVARMFMPCKIQPEFGPTINGWHSMDTSFLNEKLKEEEGSTGNKFYDSFAGRQSFRELMRETTSEFRKMTSHDHLIKYAKDFSKMIKQERIEYANPF